MGKSLIAPLLDEFLNIHPDVRLHFILEDKNLDIVSEGVDLSLRLGQAQDSSMLGRKLADNRRILCASPDYLEKHGTPTHPTDLSDHNCLIMHWGQVIDREWNFQIDGKNQTVTVSGNRASNNGALVKDWCLKGHGIAFKSIWDIRHHLESGELMEILESYRSQKPSALQIIYPGGYRPSQRVRALIDFLIGRFENDPKLGLKTA